MTAPYAPFDISDYIDSGEVMARWADHLDALWDGGQVTLLQGRRV